MRVFQGWKPLGSMMVEQQGHQPLDDVEPSVSDLQPAVSVDYHTVITRPLHTIIVRELPKYKTNECVNPLPTIVYIPQGQKG